jgi:NhaP-type Na+/H+ or K+/H+ antiporter
MLDPISIISVVEPLSISKGLYTSLFGESVLTNGVALILYEVLFQTIDYEDPTLTKVFTAIASFVLILLGSFIIGALGAFGTAYILKKFHWFIDNGTKKLNFIEAGIMTISPILTYLIAETFELSGPVTLLFSALVLSQYAAENLTLQTRKVLKLLYQGCSYICRNTIFVFLGLCVVENFELYTKASVFFILGNIVIVLGVRLISVLLCDFIINLSIKCSANDVKEKIVMWYSGLRGTLTYILALNYAQDFKESNGEVIILLVLTFSLFTV